MHMHTDDFYHYLSKGAIPPHLPESNEQNLIVIEAFLEAAKRYARGGYDVIVDGIIGPWFLKPWQSLVREHYEVHYIILRASKEETLKRAVERSKLDRKTNIELVETMWEQFCNLGIYESNVILSPIPGTRNKKNIAFTEFGRDFAEKTVGILRMAELDALAELSPEERELYIRLNEKYNCRLIEKLYRIMDEVNQDRKDCD